MMCQRRRLQILFLIMVVLGFVVACDAVGDTAVTTPTQIAIVPTAHLLPSPITLSLEDDKDFEEEIILLDFALSPDGKTLATYTNKRVEFHDVETMKSTVFMGFEDSDYLKYGGALAFSPDGKHLALSGKYFDEPVMIWEIGLHQQRFEIADLPEKYYVSELAFSPDGQSLLVRNTHEEAKHCQGYIEDKVTLHNVNDNKRIFEVDKCDIYPPLQFQFSKNDKLFLHIAGMTPEYSIQVINSETGEEISRGDYEFRKDGGYLGVSQDGSLYLIEKTVNENRGTHLISIETNELVKQVEGEVIFSQDENSFVMKNSDITKDSNFGQLEYWERGDLKCVYDGITLSPEIKTSANGERFAVLIGYWVENDSVIREFQIWDISTCELINSLPIDTLD